MIIKLKDDNIKNGSTVYQAIELMECLETSDSLEIDNSIMKVSLLYNKYIS